MTDNKEVKKVNENMDSDKETHSKDNGDVGTTTPVVPTSTDPTILPKDTPKKGETTLLKNIPEEDDIPELIVDDSEGSEGTIYELSQFQNGELDKEEVKSQDKDPSVDLKNLDKLEEEEGKKSWKLEDEMTEEDKEYFDKIKLT